MSEVGDGGVLSFLDVNLAGAGDVNTNRQLTIWYV